MGRKPHSTTAWKHLVYIQCFLNLASIIFLLAVSILSAIWAVLQQHLKNVLLPFLWVCLGYKPRYS